MDKKEISAFFDERAAQWDSIAELRPDKISRIFAAAGITQGDRVLDIACGTGILFPFYLESGVSRIDGVDLSPAMVGQCRAKFANDNRIQVMCADAEEAAFSGAYDCCMVFNAFPHFCAPQKLLQNLYVSVKPDGMVTVAHDQSRKAIDARHHGAASHISNGLMPAEELAAIFRACGFREVTSVEDDSIYIVTGKK